MAALIYLHVGLPKTGTTFLQTRTWANRTLLEAQGLRYPGAARMDHFHGTKLARGLSAPAADSQAAWQRVLDGLAEWPGRGLVSHEFFCLVDSEGAQRLVDSLPADEVRVVITARDYVRQLPAMWQETLKMGTTGPFGSYVRRQLRQPPPEGAWGWATQDLPAAVQRWSDVVGADQVDVVTVPPSGADPELLWQRWCAAIDIDDTGFAVESGRSNRSLGAAQAAVLTRVVPHVQDSLEPRYERHRWLRQYLGHEVLLEQAGERIRLTDRQRARLHARAEDAVAALRLVDVQVHGDLEDLIPAPDNGVGISPDDVPLTEQLDVAGRAIEQMVRDVQRLSRERDELAADLRRARRAQARPPRPLWRRGLRRIARLRRASPPPSTPEARQQPEEMEQP